VFVVEALFATVDDVNFDAQRLEAMVRKAAAVKKTAKQLYEMPPAQPDGFRKHSPVPLRWAPADTLEKILEQAPKDRDCEFPGHPGGRPRRP